MTKFQSGDAVRLRVSTAGPVPIRRVVWSHPDGDVTVELIKEPADDAEKTIDRIKVPADQVEYADPMLQLFRHSHLKFPLAEVSAPFGRLAHDLVFSLPNNHQRFVALQKLVEAKDAAVRARLWE